VNLKSITGVTRQVLHERLGQICGFLVLFLMIPTVASIAHSQDKAQRPSPHFVSADPNRLSWDGATPLMAAATHGWKDVVELLIRRGASVNAHGSSRNTAFHCAVSAQKENLEIVQILFNGGADIDARGSMGDTAVMIAARDGRANIVKFLAEKGANLVGAMEQAANAGHLAVVKMLIEKKVDPNTYYWRPPLCAAIESNNVQVVEYLLQHGSDVNLVCRNSLTPLHYAAARSWGSSGQKIIEMLIAWGADAKAKDDDGHSIFGIARAYQGDGGVEKFKRAGLVE
jgi:ankyrin repeat protein